MARQVANPPISSFLKISTAVEVVILLIVSIVLFFLPEVTNSTWPWQMAPFGMRYLAAVYTAALVNVGYMLFVGRWAPARVVLPMLLTFTGIVLIVSLMHPSIFLSDRPSTLAWFFLYILFPLSSLAHILIYRHLPPAESKPVPRNLSNISILVAIGLTIYATAQFIFPAESSSFWPWSVDAYHARIYSGVFFCAAVGLLYIYKNAAPVELAAVGYTGIALGVVSVLGLVYTDLQVHKLNWSAAGVWIWIAGLLVISLEGLALVLQSRKG
jgi:hypothetical protein